MLVDKETEEVTGPQPAAEASEHVVLNDVLQGVRGPPMPKSALTSSPSSPSLNEPIGLSPEGDRVVL